MLLSTQKTIIKILFSERGHKGLPFYCLCSSSDVKEKTQENIVVLFTFIVYFRYGNIQQLSSREKLNNDHLPQ